MTIRVKNSQLARVEVKIYTDYICQEMNIYADLCKRGIQRKLLI